MPATKKRPKREYSAEDMQKAVQLYREGGEIKDVSQRLGCPETTVYGWLRRAEVKLRRRSHGGSYGVSPAAAASVASVASEVSEARELVTKAEAHKAVDAKVLRAENQALRELCFEYEVQVSELQQKLSKRRL